MALPAESPKMSTTKSMRARRAKCPQAPDPSARALRLRRRIASPACAHARARTKSHYTFKRAIEAGWRAARLRVRSVPDQRGGPLPTPYGPAPACLAVALRPSAAPLGCVAAARRSDSYF